MQLSAAVVSADGYHRRGSGRDFALNVPRNQKKEMGCVEVECLGSSLQMPKCNV